MALSYIDDPKHWHIRAEETRILAAPMTDAMSKQAMLGVAAGYDRMAKRAEEHTMKSSPSAGGKILNHILSALSREDHALLLPRLERCRLKKHEELEDQLDPLSMSTL